MNVNTVGGPVGTGIPDALGAIPCADGVNFSLFSYFANEVDLLLFDSVDDGQPATVIALDSNTHRTGSYWHAFVPGVKPGRLYGYRVTGPYQLEEGMRFDPSKLLLDPYARAVVDDAYDREAASQYGLENFASAIKSVVVDVDSFDWEGDRRCGAPLTMPPSTEMHVRGFSSILAPACLKISPARTPVWSKSPEQLASKSSSCFSLPVRSAVCAGWTTQLLGLRACRILCTAQGVQFAARLAGTSR